MTCRRRLAGREEKEKQSEERTEEQEEQKVQEEQGFVYSKPTR